MEGRLLTVAVVLTALSAASCAYRPLPPSAEGEPEITLCRDRTIWTRPFQHSTVSVNDTESIVYVPGDDNLWIGDDHSEAVFEFDRRTGHYRSRVTARDLVEASPGAGSCDDGDRDSRTRCSYTDELEALAYDPTSRTLFFFNTVNNPNLDPPVDKPAVFRLQKKGGRGRFRLVDWQELPGGRRYGPAVAIEGKLYLAIGGEVVEYDAEWNSLVNVDDQGNPLPVVTAATEDHIVGMAYDGSSLWLLTSGKKLMQIDWSSRTVVKVYDVAPFGISKAKGLGFGAGEFFVVDGDYPNLVHVLRFGTLAKLAWWRGGGQSLSCG
jgi:hypothetical protein